MKTQLPDFYTVGPLPELNLGFVILPTYHVMLSLLYCLAIFWFYKRCETRNLSQKNAMELGLIVLFSSFVGARLFHVFFEYPSYYRQYPMEVLYFWQGGFVFYGGFILGYLLAFLYARKLKLTFWLWHDTLAPILAGGYALGRLACFLVGCCFGKPCDLPWAVSMGQVHVQSDALFSLSRHPTQLYASLTEGLTLLFLLWYEKRKPPLGNVFLAWVGLHSIGRIIMEIFRDDPRGGTYWGLSLSTHISIVLILTVFCVFIYRRKTSMDAPNQRP